MHRSALGEAEERPSVWSTVRTTLDDVGVLSTVEARPVNQPPACDLFGLQLSGTHHRPYPRGVDTQSLCGFGDRDKIALDGHAGDHLVVDTTLSLAS